MAEKQPRGYFELSDEELSSHEMVFIALSMLESRGYPGFLELMSVINDPSIILKIVRLFYGMELKVPPLKEFIQCLKATEYAFCVMHKKININLFAKEKDIRQFMKINEAEEQELLEIFDHWAKYMHEQGYDIRNYMHINRNSTKKRIELAIKGKTKKKAIKR
jgi:hypothetical protein